MGGITQPFYVRSSIIWSKTEIGWNNSVSYVQHSFILPKIESAFVLLGHFLDTKSFFLKQKQLSHSFQRKPLAIFFNAKSFYTEWALAHWVSAVATLRHGGSEPWRCRGTGIGGTTDRSRGGAGGWKRRRFGGVLGLDTSWMVSAFIPQ
jgi:hypothetical protein